MTEPLAVDPLRLKAAGTTLRGLVFPAPPPPIVATGTDSVSAAINQTLPIIESPVLDTLSDAKAALTKTGTNIVTAANLYAETDRTLGDHVGKVQFLAAGEDPARGATAGVTANQLAGATADKPADGEMPGTPDPAPQPTQPVFDQIPTQLGQVAAMAGAMAPVTQNMQTVMSTVQGAAGSAGSAGAAGQSPAEDAGLVDDTTKADAEEDQQSGSLPDGAAPGDQASGTVPVQPTIPSETAPSEIQL